jgi:pimeloyl-ACP methyl ester carboxylesterase
VAVCHSLGLHLLPAPVQASLDGLVVVGGFVAFGGPRRPLAGRHLQRLHRLLDGDPAAVLRDFYQDCDVGHLVPNMEGLDLARLRSDLVLLGESRFDPAGLASGPRIVLLHGDQDRIVPLELGEELHEALPGSTLAVVPGAGHGLPFTHAEACLAALERLLGDGWPGLNVENTSGPREMLCGGGPCR